MTRVKLNRICTIITISLLFSFVANAKELVDYNNLKEKVDVAKIYESDEWKYLLHYEGKRSVVDKSSSFFLHDKGYKSPRKEMYETLKAFVSNEKTTDEHAICRYPARFEFITKKLKLSEIDFPKVKCGKYDEFRTKAPIERFALVFASENNTYPTSTMGHLFIKFSGFANGMDREHAFSYFATNVDEYSPAFYFNAAFSTIDGMYILSPYELKRDDYLFFDQRSIWEIYLKLTNEQKSYIHKHMWELRAQNVRYSFVYHNCGTAAVNLLRIVYGDLEQLKLFETPIDYIRDLDDKGLVEEVLLTPSPEYNLKMIRDTYSLYDIYKIRIKNPQREDDYLNNEQKYLANMLYNYRETEGFIRNDIYLDVDEENTKIKREVKDILEAKHSSSIYVGYNHYKKDSFELEYMPLYQDFFDVSKAYIDDFETKFGAIKFVYDDEFYVSKVDIVNMRSVIDSSMSWNMVSKQFRISLENDLGVDGTNLRPTIEGGLGYAWALYDNMIKPYMLLKSGYRHSRVDNFYVLPEYGIILKPTDSSKIVVTYEKYFDSKDNNRGFDEKVSSSFAHLLSKDMTIYAKYNKYSSVTSKNDDEFSIGIGLNF